MGKREVTRRKLLAGLAGAGSIGAAVGTGTAAMVTDEVVFSNSSIRSGTLNLVVTESDTSETSNGTFSIETDLTKDQPSSTVDLNVSLPDLDGENNSAYAWVRTRCPDDELSGKLDVTLGYAQSDCTGECEIFSGSLAELVTGVPLDPAGDGNISPGDQQCLDRAEDIDLVLEVSLTDYEGEGSTSFTLEFLGTQCRYADGASNPFSTVEDCEPEDPDPDDPGKAISFVAFCTSRDGDLDPDVEGTSWDDGEPLVADWNTDVPVDFVVVKAGTNFTIYDHRDGSVTSGTVFSGDQSASIPEYEQETGNGPPDTDSSGMGSPGGNGPNDAAVPCEVAVEQLGADDYHEESSVKLEWEDGWEVED